MRRTLPIILFQFICILLLFSSLEAVSNYSVSVQKEISGNKQLFTIEVRDAEIKDVLRALAQQGGLNIIITEEVKGSVTFKFNNVPLEDALDVILKAHGLGFVIHKNVLWIGSQEELAKTGEGIITEVAKLNYADPTEMASQVKGVLSPVGSATADLRTNSLIIRDLPKGIEEAKKLIQTLDTRTPQVVIVARIVEASSNFSRELGIQWGGQGGGSNVITGGTSLSTSPGGRNFAVNLPSPGPTSGLGLVIGSLANNLTLDVELTAAERAGELKIVSQPKITTLNNQPATIRSGLTFRVRTSTTDTTQVTEVETGINLTVTPQISADNFVMLKIEAEKSDPDFSRSVDRIPGVSEKSASTTVLVRDGNTTVIGGLYRTSASETDDTVPYLSKVPLLSWLFRSEVKSLDNEELLIFITPHIVHEAVIED